MEIKRSSSQPSRKGPAENFTGTVRVDPCSMRLPRRMSLARVLPLNLALEPPGTLMHWVRH